MPTFPLWKTEPDGSNSGFVRVVNLNGDIVCTCTIEHAKLISRAPEMGRTLGECSKELQNLKDCVLMCLQKAESMSYSVSLAKLLCSAMEALEDFSEISRDVDRLAGQADGLLS